VNKRHEPAQSWRPLYSGDKKVVLSCFQAALSKRRNAPTADRELLEAHLSHINVPGFRPGKAPNDKLADGLASFCYHHYDVLIQVVPIVLRLWMESKEELRANIERSLRSSGQEINTVTSSERGFRKDWEVDSFHEIADQMCAENASEPSDAVELMLCCLTGRAPMDSKESTQNEQSRAVEIDFDAWVQALRAMSEGDPRWGLYERFVKDSERIYSEKRLLLEVAPAFKDLSASSATLHELFEFPDCASWAPSDFSSTALEQAVADIRKMLLRLEMFHVPVSGSHKQQMEQLEQRKAAGNDIQDIYSRLSALRNQEIRDSTTIPANPLEPPPAPEQPGPIALREVVFPVPPIIPALGDERFDDANLDAVSPESGGTTVDPPPAVKEETDDTSRPSDAQPETSGIDKPIQEELPTANDREAETQGLSNSVAQERNEIPPHDSPDTPVATIESDGVSAATTKNFATMESHLWRLVSEGRSGVAGALADALAQSQPMVRHALPRWLLEAVGLSRSVITESSDIARSLEAAFAQFDEAELLENVQSEQAAAVGLLLVAASVRPALIAPRTGASRLLHAALKIVPPDLYELCSAIADFGDRLQPLEPALLREVKGEAVWSESVAALQGRAAEWLQKAAQAKISYAPASRVLWKWLERGQPINSLLQPVRQDDHSKLGSVREAILRFSDAREAKKLVDDTDRKVLGRRLGSPITAGALAQLQVHLGDAIAMARDWVSLNDQKLGRSKGFKLGVAERIRTDVARCCPGSIEGLRHLGRRFGNSPRGYAAVACAAALADVQTLFDIDRPFSAPDQNPNLSLRGELLYVAGISLGENWEIEQGDAHQRFDAIRRYLLEPKPDNRSTLHRLCQEEDHLATARLIESATAQSDPEAASFEPFRTEALANARSAVKRSAVKARREIDKAAAFSYINEAERADFTADVERIRDQADDAIRFRSLRDKIAGSRSIIRERRKQEVDAVQERLLQIAPNHPDRPRITALLFAGDVITANDYVEMLRNGESLPTNLDEDRDAFCEFFPKMLQKIEQLFEEDKKPQTLIHRILSGKNFADIDMSQVPSSQTQTAAAALELWHELKRERKINEKSARALLDFLGFNVLSAKITRLGRREWIDVKTDPVSSRDRCPLPHFGSQARGTYRIHCIWDRPPEEDLINHVGNSSHGTASIVFYFGRMSEAKRRELARLSIRGKNTFVLLDETLLVYLCGERGSRMPVFFRCSLPFTFYEPYTTTAGLLAPEMFYGRDYERRSIIDPMGSCFIYGGRQLGKTVLLRDVQRQVHDLENNRIAIWLDLKAKGIGYDRPVDDLWVILAGEFKSINILPPTVQVHASPEKIIEHTRSWLSANPDARILLLLDEADRFLEIDGGGRGDSSPVGLGEFARSSRLKGLMDDTNRRFKVVFAGLHNVQRTTQLENHPLAHFGEALCIGPLLNGTERREACWLVEHPLAALGYRFESPDLAMRLVAQANYYPSLIQLYCSHLLQHVTARSAAAFQVNSSPPYLLTSKHLDEAYDSRELQTAIRDRLLWTLQLDQRYEVLAYVIAYTFLIDRDQGMARGFPVSQIRQDALGCWPDGFKDHVSEQSFQILLDEMVGLGVLRLRSPGHYTLRSPNVLNLMGSTEEIEAALSRKREPAPQYDAAAFRASHPREHYRRSPLTALQESRLRTRDHGVLAIFGVEAAGLNEVVEFLESSFGKDAIVNCKDVANLEAFAERLQELQERRAEAQTLVFVPAACPWTDVWLEEALRKTEKLRSKNSFVRVLFVGDPATAWRWAGGNPISERLSSLGLTVMTLEPWQDAMVRQWLDDCGFRPTPEFRKTIGSLTGYWPSLLYQVHALLKQAGGASQVPIEALARVGQTALLSSADLFGLKAAEEAAVVLKHFAGLNLPASVEDLASLLEMPKTIVLKSIHWADLLGLVRPAGIGLWQIDSALAQILNGAA
jgi:hypothetical protein